LKGRILHWRLVLLCAVVITLRAQDQSSSRQIRVLAFGDVNLGRAVGQKLLQGDLEYPFALVQDTLSRAHAVLVNLESQLSDQGGQTQHPQFDLIFCGPPEGAFTLKGANISVVSTANNHAYDYGIRGLRETIDNLRAAGVLFTGTAEDSVSRFPPAILDIDSIRIGFVAYTKFVNLKGPWQGRIALFDELMARQAISELRHDADFVIASYHSDVEYSDRPTASARKDMKALVDAGADVVIGHHPHYVQGIERYQNKLIFYSLGNFVFYQPRREWTQRGLGIELRLAKSPRGVALEDVRLLPVRAGLQPSFSLTRSEEQAFIERLKKLSTVEIQEINGSWFTQIDPQSKDN
jgi:poly-gamma-glutamate synthesis protein (capsule biosynthesis protein)